MTDEAAREREQQAARARLINTVGLCGLGLIGLGLGMISPALSLVVVGGILFLLALVAIFR